METRLTFITPNTPEASAAAVQLRRAYSHLENGQKHFADICKMIANGEAGVYLAHDENTALYIVGETVGTDYHLLAVGGRGLRRGISALIAQAKKAGFKAIVWETAKRGVRRLQAVFDGVTVSQIEQGEGLPPLTMHKLEL
ncbi:hypothetical protein [Salinivibrio sp. KP-1]|uniref:hypothetical protein n=1 Tax=Salinivibrio sp. KP-1 TaxID=1406902 RepID=UPI0006144A2F|nr:hypothetical protein [Salinivibrio sp. KP-1]KKA43748.1 hypothetical protein WN56_15585 [Salinivibrio sp. KP-1]